MQFQDDTGRKILFLRVYQFLIIWIENLIKKSMG